MVGERKQFILGELCSLITDGKHGDCQDDPDSGFYFLSVKDVLDNRLVYENARQITKEDFLETHRRTNLEPGDVLFTNTGTIGRMAIAPSDPRTFRTTFQKSVAILKPRHDLIEPSFLYYLLHFDNARLSDFAAGTTQKNLLLKDLRSFAVEVPDLPEQRAISHILRALDDKIELNQRMNETLEAMARALFKSWFVDFDPVRAKAEGLDPSLPKPIADLFPDSFKDSEVGEIPNGWDQRPLGAIAELMIGGDWGRDSPGPDDVPVRCLRGVDLDSLRRTGWSPAPRRFVSRTSFEKRRPEFTDVLVEGSGECGRSLAICDELAGVFSEPVIYSNFCKRLRTASASAALFVEYVLNGLVTTGGMKSFVTGTAMPNLDHKGLLTGLMVALPSADVLEVFGGLCSSARRRLFSSESRTLAALRDALLPRLISGELRVKNTARFAGPFV